MSTTIQPYRMHDEMFGCCCLRTWEVTPDGEAAGFRTWYVVSNETTARKLGQYRTRAGALRRIERELS